jgi:hypothetical protein
VISGIRSVQTLFPYIDFNYRHCIDTPILPVKQILILFQVEVEELCELWTCLKDLACVAEKHIQHHNDYELFWKRLNNANLWITQKRNLLDTR